MEIQPRKRFHEMFPTVPDDCLKILDKTLRFDPRKRLTVKEAL